MTPLVQCVIFSVRPLREGTSLGRCVCVSPSPDYQVLNCSTTPSSIHSTVWVPITCLTLHITDSSPTRTAKMKTMKPTKWRRGSRATRSLLFLGECKLVEILLRKAGDFSAKLWSNSSTSRSLTANRNAWVWVPRGLSWNVHISVIASDWKQPIDRGVENELEPVYTMEDQARRLRSCYPQQRRQVSWKE